MFTSGELSTTKRRPPFLLVEIPFGWVSNQSGLKLFTKIRAFYGALPPHRAAMAKLSRSFLTLSNDKHKRTLCPIVFKFTC
jgi:hypothetical protein